MKKILKRLAVLATTGLLFLALVACSNQSSSSSSASQVSVTDANGEVKVPADAKKIVVLDYGVADTLRALGLEDRIVGLPTDTLPSYLSDLKDKEGITNVGNLKEVDLEKIAELQPDLIIASGRTAAQVDKFNEIAPTLYFETNASSYWDDTKKNITEFAKIFGDDVEKKAEDQIADIDKVVTEATSANKDTKKTTLFLMLNEGQIAAYGENGRFGFVYSTLGFKPTSLEIDDNQTSRATKGSKDSSKSSESSSSASSSSSSESSASSSQSRGGGGNAHGNSVSYESIAQVNPDIIFVVDRTVAIGGDASKDSDLLSNSLIQGTNAGKNKKIVTLTSDLWYLSGGGLESTKLMFEEVAKQAGN